MARSASPPRRGTTRRPGARAAAARRRAREARRQRWAVAAAVAGVLVPALALGGVALMYGASDTPAALSAPPAPAAPDSPAAPASPCDAIARYSDAQLANAEIIIAAGSDAGLPERDQTIGVMTAMGESSLRNIDYGDWETSAVTNPDGAPTTSVGLFQQQDGWGTREERLDPHTAATFFYLAMTKRVPEPERSETEPTIVAHRTQINKDPQHYARYWERAQQIVTALGAGGCR